MPMTIDERLQRIEQRLQRLEGTTIPLATTQVQAISDVSDTATTDEVRTSVQQIARALRTLRLGH